jgi:hypothetical protein
MIGDESLFDNIVVFDHYFGRLLRLVIFMLRSFGTLSIVALKHKDFLAHHFNSPKARLCLVSFKLVIIHLPIITFNEQTCLRSLF